MSFGIDQRNAEGARVFAALPFLAAKFPHRQFTSAELRVLSGVGRTAFPMRGAKALSGEVSWGHVKWRTCSAASNTECSFDDPRPANC